MILAELLLMAAPRPVEEAVYLLFWYPSICVSTKRLHDLGRSGWWQLISWIAGAPIMFTGWAVAVREATVGAGSADLLESRYYADPVFMGLSMAGFVVSIAFLLYLGFARGQDKSNRYGRTADMVNVEDVF